MLEIVFASIFMAGGGGREKGSIVLFLENKFYFHNLERSPIAKLV